MPIHRLEDTGIVDRAAAAFARVGLQVVTWGQWDIARITSSTLRGSGMLKILKNHSPWASTLEQR